MAEALKTTLDRWLLGPKSSFRNGHRTWLYLAYLVLVIGLLAAVGLKG